MKKVAINTRFLLKNKLEGFGWFTYYVSKQLAERNPNIQFYFLFDRAYDPSFVFSSNVKPIVLRPQARHPLLFRWWFNVSVTSFLKKNNIDVFISPDGYLSLKTDIPQISVIHDLNFEHYPEDLKPHHSRYLRKYFPRFAQKASDIITVSEFSKNDIIKTYKIDESKISIAFNGVSEHFKPKEETTSNPNDKKPYFLFVGSIHPRKNLKRLLLAFDDFKKQMNSAHQLLVIGDPYFWNDEMKNTLNALVFQSDVIFKPYASVQELIEYYQNAEALMFVSYFEGFGIPIIEAMACACPVVVARNTACEEIAGNAAYTIDPFDYSDICNGMISIVSNVTLRQDLILKGIERSKFFDWKKTAESVEKILYKYISTNTSSKTN